MEEPASRPECTSTNERSTAMFMSTAENQRRMDTEWSAVKSYALAFIPAAVDDSDNSFYRLTATAPNGMFVVLSFDGGEEWTVGTYASEEAEQGGENINTYTCTAVSAAQTFTQECSR